MRWVSVLASDPSGLWVDRAEVQDRSRLRTAPDCHVSYPMSLGPYVCMQLRVYAWSPVGLCIRMVFTDPSVGKRKPLSGLNSQGLRAVFFPGSSYSIGCAEAHHWSLLRKVSGERSGAIFSCLVRVP